MGNLYGGDVLLNLGCGDYNAPAPWVNIDKHPSRSVRPDIVADASSLPFGDATADAVYCGHLLEHLGYEDELPAVLAEVRRVLLPGGAACFVGPDYDRAMSNPEWAALGPAIRDGGQRWVGDEHRWLSTGPRTLQAVRAVFPGAEEVDLASLDPSWPVWARDGWQFAILTEILILPTRGW